ncbi:MAG TPA: hypothetical protein VGC41_23400, partial [Kofleriaceae bacterium]
LADVPTAAVRTPASSKLPLFLVLAILVLVGAGATTYVVFRKSGPTPYASVTKADGLALTEGKFYEKVKLLVESDGTIKPDDVLTAYVSAQQALISSNKKVFETVNIALAERIVVLPQSYLCSPSLYGARPPKDCAMASFSAAYGKDGKTQLLIANDRAKLGDTMKLGVATLACLFQPETMAAGTQVQAICDASKQFKATVERPAGN